MRKLLIQVLTVICCLYAVTAQNAGASSYFRINPNVLEDIRGIINSGNQDALQSVSTEVLEKIRELVEAEIEKFRYLGQSPRFAVRSRRDIKELQPCTSSGYYWINTESSPLGIWCEMEAENRFNATGGFMKIADIDMRNNATTCPKGLRMVTPEGSSKRLCSPVRTAAGADSFIFDTHCVNYSTVCGRITGYQFGLTDAFHTYAAAAANSRAVNPTLDTYNYVDGVSITHGSPRRHIWTLAAGRDEVRTASDVTRACPCSNTEVPYTGQLPPYIDDNFYCETGSRGAAQSRYYFSDPLWNGSGCGPDSTCCDHSGWWCRELGYHTTDDIEVRIITNEAKHVESILLETIELYVH